MRAIIDKEDNRCFESLAAHRFVRSCARQRLVTACNILGYSRFELATVRPISRSWILRAGKFRTLAARRPSHALATELANCTICAETKSRPALFDRVLS